MGNNRVYDVSGREEAGATKFVHGEGLSGVPEEQDASGFNKCLLTAAISVLFMLCLVVLLLVFVASSHSVSVTPFKWPPPSHSVMGSFNKFAIATDNSLCADIGKEMMAAGGNAADAAIAAMFCLGATNPQSSGLGGGFVMTLYNKTTGSCVAIDARETAPAAATRDMFKNDNDGSKYGFKASAVPGELAGYWTLFTRFASGRIPWPELIRPTIRLLKAGVPVSKFLADTMAVKERHFRLFPSMREWINPATNMTYVEGDLLPRLKLMRTLERLAEARDPEHLFYRGEFADIIDREMKANGGIIRKEDLSAYKVRIHEAALVNEHFREGLAMCGGPPPASFAVTQLIVNTMSKLYPATSAETLLSSPLAYHHQLEAMKLAYAQRTLLGDAAFVPAAQELAQRMTTQAFTQDILDKVKNTAQPTQYYGGDGSAQSADHGTSHVSVMDGEGNGIAVTTTINRWFGAAVQSDELGILWNDEMDDFSTPGKPNGFGFAPSTTNYIEPGKRPMSSMSPLVVYEKESHKIRMVAGASGGARIISALAKAVTRSLIFGETIKQAIDSPLLHNQFTPDITHIDDSFPKELKTILESQYGQRFQNTTGFEGIVQAIVVREGKLMASGDFRRKTDQTPAGI